MKSGRDPLGDLLDGLFFGRDYVVYRRRITDGCCQTECFCDIGSVRELTELVAIAVNNNPFTPHRLPEESGDYGVASHAGSIGCAEPEDNGLNVVSQGKPLSAEVACKFANCVRMTRRARMGFINWLVLWPPVHFPCRSVNKSPYTVLHRRNEEIHRSRSVHRHCEGGVDRSSVNIANATQMAHHISAMSKRQQIRANYQVSSPPSRAGASWNHD